MRFPTGIVDQYLYFVGIKGSDLVTRQIGMSGKFKVYRSRNGAAAAAYTTPTINETDATNMPGVYELLVDEDMTIDAGDYSQEVSLHITTTDTALSTDSIVPVTRVFELYNDRMTTATGGLMTILDNVANLDVSLETATDMLSNIQDVLIPNLDVSLETATDMLSNIQDVLFPALEVSITYATRGIDQLIVEHAAFETSITYAAC